MSSKNPERLIFDGDRGTHPIDVATPSFVKDSRGWIMFGPMDIRLKARTYLFCLQQLRKQKEPRVRVGCRYYTLREAYHHWSRKARGKVRGGASAKNEGRQAIAIIRLMLVQAQAYGLISMYRPVPKFDSSIMKRKK